MLTYASTVQLVFFRVGYTLLSKRLLINRTGPIFLNNTHFPGSIGLLHPNIHVICQGPIECISGVKLGMTERICIVWSISLTFVLCLNSTSTQRISFRRSQKRYVHASSMVDCHLILQTAVY